MAAYQQLHDPMTGEISTTILRVADQAYIPDDPANRDRQEYDEWLAAGNQPDPPDAPPAPPTPAPVTLPANPTQPMHATTMGYVDGEILALRSEVAPLDERISVLRERVEALEARMAALG